MVHYAATFVILLKTQTYFAKQSVPCLSVHAFSAPGPNVCLSMKLKQFGCFIICTAFDESLFNTFQQSFNVLFELF